MGFCPSAMLVNTSWIRRAQDLSIRLLKTQAMPTFILGFLSVAVSLTCENALSQLTPESESQRWAWQLSLGLWDLFEGVMIFLILSWGIPKAHSLKSKVFHKAPFTESYLSSFFAEYLRLLAQVLLFGLLLIIPGFIRYCRLIFMPYIALFADAYRKDEVDAKELSLDLSQGRMRLIVSVFGLSTIVQLALEFAPHLNTGLHAAPIRVLFIALSFWVGIFTYSFIFLIFERALEEHEWT